MFKNIFLLTLILFSQQVSAVLDIEITGGVIGEHPIAIVPFSWEVKSRAGQMEVSEVVTADLSRTGRFELVPASKFLERPHHGDEINFENWRAVGVESLVVGRVLAGENGQLQVQFQLFDVYKRSSVRDGGPSEPEYKIKQLIGYSLPTSYEDLRRTAHYMSDLIYETLTGDKGVFTTRIAYITADTRAKEKTYELQIADMDGYNAFTVLKSQQPIMSPSWSADARQLAYVTFENKKSQIYVQQVDTGTRKLVSSQKGVNSAPAWSPDGRRLALTLSRDGSLEIYTLDLLSKKLTRLTRNTAIDTEPAWSPDGKTIVFVSDRSGKPQVYRMSAQGGRAERITFQGKYNARPSFSPDGKKITMVHGNSEGFHIAILDVESGVLDVLTDGSLDESPSFAPNGSMILYATAAKRRGILSAVSTDGKVKQRLVLQQGDVREPAWAPYRK